MYTFLCKQKQKQTLPSKWEKYCIADVSLFSKAEMNRFYNASDSDIDALKQVSGSKNTKKSTLTLFRIGGGGVGWGGWGGGWGAKRPLPDFPL